MLRGLRVCPASLEVVTPQYCPFSSVTAHLFSICLTFHVAAANETLQLCLVAVLRIK